MYDGCHDIFDARMHNKQATVWSGTLDKIHTVIPRQVRIRSAYWTGLFNRNH